MAPASVAVSLPFRVLPAPRLLSRRRARPRSVRASSDARGVAGGERKAGALGRRVGELRALVASVSPAVASIRENIGLNFVAGFCLGVALLAAVARRVIIRSRERDNKGSVADLVRRGQLKSRQGGSAKLRTFDDPFNNTLVKIDEGTSTAQMFGKEYRLAPVRLTREQQAMHRKRRSRTYHWKRPTVFLREGDSLPPDVDPDTVRWIPANHPFAAASSEVDEETAKQNVYQKDGIPSRVKAEHEALQIRHKASNDVTAFHPHSRNMQGNEIPLKLSGKSSGSMQDKLSKLSGEPSRSPDDSDFQSLENQNRQPLESSRQSTDETLQPKRLENQ